jgi:ABC-type amino acid transport substrate-binding protein
MLRKFLLTLTALGLTLCCTTAPAQPTAALPPTLRCYDDLFPPYFMETDERVHGLNVDIMTEAARRAGIAVTFQRMPWRRLEAELARPGGSVDCAFALSRTPEREVYLNFGSVALQPTDYVLFVRRPGAPGSVTGLSGLDDKTIGVRAGFRLPDVIRDGAARERWTLSEVATDTANFTKLDLNRLDAVLADRISGLYALKQLNLADIGPLQPALLHFDTYVVFRKSSSSAALAAAFDRALKSMYQDGTVTRLSGPYTTRARPQPRADGRPD